MATVIAYRSVDLSRLDLHGADVDQIWANFVSGAFETPAGYRTSNHWFVDWWGQPAGTSYWLGDGLSWGGGLNGTLTGLYRDRQVDGHFVAHFEATGITLDGRDVYTATNTPSTDDDAALLRTMFIGGDRFQLSAGADVANGFGGNDELRGGGGGDTLVGSTGDDTLIGASGADRLGGGSGDDLLQGGTGGDILAGGPGRDTLAGGAADDSLAGHSGDDLLAGGAGLDTLVGGAGHDTFRFDTPVAAAEADRILDFASGADRIELDHTVFTALGAPGALHATAWHTGSAAGDADDRIVYDPASGTLYYDPDGSGAAAPSAIARLGAGTPLLAGDIWVV